MMPHPSATTFSKYVLFEEATSSTLVNMLLSSFGLLDKSNEIKFLPAIGILQKKIYLIVQKKSVLLYQPEHVTSNLRICEGCGIMSPLDTIFLDAISDKLSADHSLKFISFTCRNLDKVDSDSLSQIWTEHWNDSAQILLETVVSEMPFYFC
jgi:hypothetical protein